MCFHDLFLALLDVLLIARMAPQITRYNYLDGITEGEVGGELQVAQAHAGDWAGPVALGQPALDAHPVVRVPGRHHHRIGHQLLHQTARCGFVYAYVHTAFEDHIQTAL